MTKEDILKKHEEFNAIRLDRGSRMLASYAMQEYKDQELIIHDDEVISLIDKTVDEILNQTDQYLCYDSISVFVEKLKSNLTKKDDE